MTAFKE